MLYSKTCVKPQLSKRQKMVFKMDYRLMQVKSITECSPFAGPRSAVGNVSGYRCVSDCRSRGREFDPGPVPYFRGDLIMK